MRVKASTKEKLWTIVITGTLAVAMLHTLVLLTLLVLRYVGVPSR